MLTRQDLLTENLNPLWHMIPVYCTRISKDLGAKVSTSVDVNRVKSAMVEIISKQSQGGNLQTRSVLEMTLETLNIQRNRQNEQVLLTIFHDLFRSGYIAWGLDFSNSNPPFFHVTEQGRMVLQNFSRDPANPGGYLAYLDKTVTINPIARSYLVEALKTFNSDYIKSSAIMVGVAAESMTLELRDVLVQRMKLLNLPITKDFVHWQIKRVLDSIYKELERHKRQIPPKLAEFFEQFWTALVGQIRICRNDAGHPTSIDPITFETVQASLLIFNELARLVNDLKEWIPVGFGPLTNDP